MTRRLAPAAALALALSLTAPAGAGPEPARPAPAPPDPAVVEAARRVLDLEDRRAGDPAAWAPLLRSPLTEVRRRAARGAGRVRAVGLGPALREALGAEADETVVAELVFALGLTGDPASVDALLALLRDERAGTRARAVAALARHGAAVPPAALLPALADPAAEVRGAAALALARLRGRRAPAAKAPLDRTVARALLRALAPLAADADPEVRWRAAYALMDVAGLDAAGLDVADPRARADLLEALVVDADPRARLFAVRGLAAADLAPARRLEVLRRRARPAPGAATPEERDPHVLAAVAAGLGRVGDPAAAPDLLALASAGAPALGPAGHHARQAALAALLDLLRPVGAPPAGPPPAGPGAGAEAQAARAGALALVAGLCDPARPVAPALRAVALDGLLRLAPEAEGARAAARAASSPAVTDRAALAGAARWLPPAARDEALARLARDPSPRVVAAALDGLGSVAEVDSAAGGAARAAALAALPSPDLAVRGTAVGLLAAVGRADDLPALAAALAASPGPEWAEVRGEASKAALAWARAEGAPPEARARAAALLADLQRDEALAVRTAAAAALAELEGRPAPAPAPDDSTSTVAVEPGVDLLRSRPDPRAVLHTARGDVLLELLREEAPRHVKSFLTLARAGRYDGLPLHRVVPGFVVQGLDPRGDGWGSGGVRLRDELNQVPFLRGAVGMPSSGPDTGGCQLFVTHVPTPHLDGGYTVFARVVAGLDVVDALDVGDVVTRVEVLPE